METTGFIYHSDEVENLQPSYFSHKRHYRNYVASDLSCTCGKDVYLTYGDADRARHYRPARLMSKEIYRCNLCNRYHLTTKCGRGRRPKPYDRLSNKQILDRTMKRYSDSNRNAFQNTGKKSYWVLQVTF